MLIKDKLYPYPVISKNSKQYLSSKFEVLTDVKKVGYQAKFEFLSELTNVEIKSLIETGQAIYVYHIECPLSSYRKAFTTVKNEDSFLVDEKKLTGNVKVCSFIVTAEDIIGFSSEDFSSDYRGYRFDLPQGYILAIGDEYNILIDKEKDNLNGVSSIFSVIINHDEKDKSTIVDIENQKIIIKVPKDVYYGYSALYSATYLESIFNSLIVVPVLSHVLSTLLRIDFNERNVYEGKRWYRSLRRRLKKNFDLEIESETINNLDMFKIAQALVDYPLINAINSLVGKEDIDYGDD